jgi:hypothetical protein
VSILLISICAEIFYNFFVQCRILVKFFRVIITLRTCKS